MGEYDDSVREDPAYADQQPRVAQGRLLGGQVVYRAGVEVTLHLYMCTQQNVYYPYRT